MQVIRKQTGKSAMECEVGMWTRFLSPRFVRKCATHSKSSKWTAQNMCLWDAEGLVGGLELMSAFLCSNINRLASNFDMLQLLCQLMIDKSLKANGQTMATRLHTRRHCPEGEYETNDCMLRLPWKLMRGNRIVQRTSVRSRTQQQHSKIAHKYV